MNMRCILFHLMPTDLTSGTLHALLNSREAALRQGAALCSRCINGLA